MKEKKTSSSWKLAIIYFLAYLVLIVAFSIVYSLIVVLLPMLLKFSYPVPVNWILEIIPILIIPTSIILGSNLIQKKFSVKNPRQVVLYSTIIYLIIKLLFLLRDFLITEIHGMPLVRDHTWTIISDALTLLFFYYFSKAYFTNKSFLQKPYQQIRLKLKELL